MWKGAFSKKDLLSTAPEYAEPEKDVFALTPIGTPIDLCKIARKNTEQHLVLVDDDNLRISASAVDSFPQNTIPFETHERQTQYVLVAQGKAKITMFVNKTDDTDATIAFVEKSQMFVIPHNTKHKIAQVGETPLKVISMYSTVNKK